MELNNAISLIDNENLRHAHSAVWADLGAGSGLFTHALAATLQPGSIIYAIDKIHATWQKHPTPRNILIEQRQLNFITDELNLTNLDGILMAISLHFAKNKLPLVLKLSKCLKQEGGFLIVEYDTNSSNPWVPYPVSFYSLKELFEKAGYTHVEKLRQMPSAFGRSFIYAAYIDR